VKAPLTLAHDEGREGRPARGAVRERAARIIERAVFTLALVLIVLAAIPYGSAEVWWTSFFGAGILALAPLWAAEATLRGGWQWRRLHGLVLPPLALLLFCALQLASVSADPSGTRFFLLRLAALTLLGAILLRYTTSAERLHALVLTVICVGVGSAVFGLVRQAAQPEGVGFILPALPRGVGYGQIISRNQFAFMMEMSLGLALGLVFRRGGRSEVSIFYASLALPIGAALILANSRGGILTMMCQVLFLAVLAASSFASRGRGERRGQGEGHREEARPRRLLRSVLTSVVLVAALVFLVSAAIVWVGGEPVVSNLSTVSEELGAEDSAGRWNTRRVDIWRATWEMIKDHPVAGVGFGGYWTAVTAYHDASGEYTPQQAHNDYLELLAGGGLVGFAIALWFAVIVLRRARRVLRRGDSFRRAAATGALVGLFGVAVHSLFDFGLHLTINAALFVALLVVAVAEVESKAGKSTTTAPA
jgi:O-antigen ligase